MLYSLNTITHDMQTAPHITSLLELHVHKIAFLIEVNSTQLCE